MPTQAPPLITLKFGMTLPVPNWATLPGRKARVKVVQPNTSFVLGSGTHTLIAQSMSAGTFQVLNKSQVTITVP
jgi:hypothetical protein